MEEMISAKDLYYLPKVKNLRREYDAVLLEIDELEETWNEYLEFEDFTIFELNMIHSRKQTAYLLKEAIEKEIERIRLETLN